MQVFERAMTLDDKKARYYDLSALVNNDKNAPLSPAHFYGGNGFTAGVYLPLLTKLSESFTINSLAMRGYWSFSRRDCYRHCGSQASRAIFTAILNRACYAY